MINLIMIIVIILIKFCLPQCNNYFPKTVGGTLDQTYFNDIDANFAVDIVVGAGDSFDGGISCSPASWQPMIAAFCIKSSLFKWGKTDCSSNPLGSAQKVQLSPNGLYLIVLYTSGNILFLNSGNGAQISAYTYSRPPFAAKDFITKVAKALLLKSDSNAAYILDNQPTTGQQFFRINPHNTSPSAPVWA